MVWLSQAECSEYTYTDGVAMAGCRLSVASVY